MILLSSCSILSELGTSPNSETANDMNLYSFPLDLYCESIVEGDGSNWDGITIGSSSLGNLADTLFLLSEEYEIFSEGNEVRFSIFDRSAVRNTTIPTTVEACVVDEIVMALAIVHNLTDLPSLDDYIARYGEPDAVTWSEFETSRVVFWFEEGIVADVGVTDDGFGVITLSVYMPYQSVMGFETRWPFNRTRSTPPLAGDVVYNPPLPSDQNPFDFDAMIATITAEPSRTPTFTPIATEVP